MRPDLLALTADDLAALTNRGTVKRAQKELENNDPACEITSDGQGEVIVTWSDGIVCRFLAGKTIHDAVCSSGALGITRHIVRSILAYQQLVGSTPSAEVSPDREESDAASGATTEKGTDQTPPAAPTQGKAWDPGQITDEALIATFRSAAVAKAKKRFEQGVLVELTRGEKPVARFLDEACTVRFPVPGDVRYATADCSEALWPLWIPLAVWAFRELPADQLAGLISLQRTVPEVKPDVFTGLRMLLDELCRDGVSGVAPSWPQRLQRTEKQLRDEGLVWPAELVLELLQQHELYHQHDARFDPDQLAPVLGELLARSRAILRGTTPVPQLLIRGTKSDRPTDIGSGRFTGVGLGVRPGRRQTTLSAYLQDITAGHILAVERTFSHPDPASGELPRPFDDLAATVLVRGVSLGRLAMSQLLVRSGKRTPSGQLVLPRMANSFTVNPQSFQWEQWKPPFAAESFAQLQARLRILPPSYLRPRRCTENLHGIAVVGTERVDFDHAGQQLTASLRDAQGVTAWLVHPFHTRGAAGFNALFEMLRERGEQLQFVCGHVSIFGQSLVIRPVLLIFDDGSHRVGISPCVASLLPGVTPDAAQEISLLSDVAEETDERRAGSEAEQFLVDLQQSLGELLLLGIARDPARATQILAERARQSRQLGFIQIAAAVNRVADALSVWRDSLDWTPEIAIAGFQELCLISRLAAE